jgi:catechol 2,3-dioxygenase-like lactoylglutathione lyase family enzyme
MKIKMLIPAMILSLMFAWPGQAQTNGQTDALPAPHFHHLHLNSVDPDAAISFYTKEFPSTSKTTVAGFPALQTGKVYVLFTKVSSPPPTTPPTAIWHFGWHVVDVHKNLDMYRERKEVQLLPLFTSDEGGMVYTSGDTWPGMETKSQMAEAKAKGLDPQRGAAGFAYLLAPDHSLVEYQGNLPAERFNHVHMNQEYPICAQLWYEKHLDAPVRPAAAGTPQYTEANCKVPNGEPSWPALERQGTIRKPAAGTAFDDNNGSVVTLPWYPRQGDKPLVGTRGHLADHIGLSVTNLDAWVAKLRKEGVKFLEQPYKFGDTRAVMIEGPSLEAIELVEVK